MSDTPTSALAFANSDGLIATMENAMDFAGPGGRIATLPDIIDARLASPFGSSVWESWFTTASSEFYGLSPAGIPLVVVAHGIGPMSDKKSVLAAYAHQYKDKTRSRRGGRIPMDVFRRLVDGGFGDVDVVEMSTVLADGHEFPFSSRTPEELLGNPLWIARLGGLDRAGAYVGKLAAHALMARKKEAANTKAVAAVGFGTIIDMEQPSDDPYTVYKPTRMSEPLEYEAQTDLPHGALAHLLAIGRVFTWGATGDHLPQIKHDIGTHDWTDSCKLVGIRGGGKLTGVLRQLDRYDAIRENRELLWIEDSGEPASVTGFGPLVKIGDDLYTQYPKVGDAQDTASAMNLVTSFEELGEPVLMTTPGSFFLRYNRSEARQLAPKGANAYRIVGEVTSDYTNMFAHLQFYRVVVDRSSRLMTEKEIHADSALLAKLAGAD